MNDFFTKQFADMFKTAPYADMFKAAPYGQFPDQMQTMVQDGLSKTRDAALQSIEFAKGGADALSKANTLAGKEATALTNKAFEQVTENTEAAFVAAQAIALAKSPMEAAQLQAKYWQVQFAKAGAQSKDLFELSTKLAQKSAEAVTTLAAKGKAA